LTQNVDPGLDQSEASLAKLASDAASVSIDSL